MLGTKDILPFHGLISMNHRGKRVFSLPLYSRQN